MISYSGLITKLQERNMTKSDLVSALGISSRTVAKIGRGEKIADHVLKKIADHLGCPPDALWEDVSQSSSDHVSGTTDGCRMLLIRNAVLYDPACRGKKDVLIAFDRILAVEDSISPMGYDTEVIDASGMILVPGLIDQHVHVIGGGGEEGPRSRVPEIAFSEIVKAGVTTLVGVLGTDGVTRDIETLLAKTKALNEEGVTARCLTSAYNYPPVTLTGSVMRDIVFLSEVLGCKLAVSDHRASHPTRDEIIRLVSEVRMAGLIGGKPGVLHIHVGVDPAGIEPLMDVVRTTDIPIFHFRPTHMALHAEQAVPFTGMGGYADFTASDSLAALLYGYRDRLDLSFVTISSDSNGSMPKWDAAHEHVIGMGVGRMTSLLRTLRQLVREGFTLEQALPFLTENVARGLLMYPKKGTVRPGSDADMLLLREDLTADTLVSKGHLLMRGGRVVKFGYYEEQS